MAERSTPGRRGATLCGMTPVRPRRSVLYGPASNARALEKARCVGYLAGVALKAIEAGDLAARLEAVEATLKARRAG